MRGVRACALSAAVTAAWFVQAHAATIEVHDPASLALALRSVAVDGDAVDTDNVIRFADDIVLGGDLPAVNLPAGATLTIDGDGHALDGGGVARGLFVYSGTATIRNLAIRQAVAHGGKGRAGGGAGAGLGGALFVATDGRVTLDGVAFEQNAAAGGDAESGNRGGGGGLGGDGASQGGGVCGGGGGVGVGADGGSIGVLDGLAGIVAGAASGGDLGGSLGGADGGGGAASLSMSSVASGGGVAGQSGNISTFNGGGGGFGGGGGAGFVGGPGGFGGGGGSSGGGAGGNGGFGGGGGQGQPTAFGGFGGGDATDGGNPAGGIGGAGAGFGGAVFVMDGATLAIAGPSTIAGGSAVGGNASGGVTTAAAGGAGLFLHGAGTLEFSPASGQLQSVSDSITDMASFVDAGYVPPAWCGATCFDASRDRWSLAKTGVGVLVLTGDHALAAGASVSEGLLEIGDGTTATRFDGDVTASGNGFLAGAGTIDGTIGLGSGGVLLAGPIDLPVGTLHATTLGFADGTLAARLSGDVSDVAEVATVDFQPSTHAYRVVLLDGSDGTFPSPGTTYSIVKFDATAGNPSPTFTWSYFGMASGVAGSLALTAEALTFTVTAATPPPPPVLTAIFVPDAIPDTATTQLVLTLRNDAHSTIAVTTALAHVLPAGLRIGADAPSTDCANATVAAVPGDASFSLAAGAQISADGSCTVVIPVAGAAGTYEDGFAAGVLHTTSGQNADAVVAPLSISADRVFADGFDPAEP
ncbi:hypothetical protein [Dokdonella sp.]|uniref:DUF7933 domain-containing protein n=1 Tax=Dokdonella sp. TaxID=2291710 RepID=UPI001B2B5588|nr:hypothetical protein [Dokdonella sp.]MBO9663572.1 hypothetical protein [Dokdonella sp.]